MSDKWTKDDWLNWYRHLEETEYEVGEAELSYAARKKLPTGAFCDPANRAYPAHDAKHVRAGLQRLSQFASSMSPARRTRIFNCLSRRAKKYGIEVSDDVRKKLRGKKVAEALEESGWSLDEWINWIMEEDEIKCEV